MRISLLTLTAEALGRILPQETASSGRAPVSEPSNCNLLSVSPSQVAELFTLESDDVPCHKHYYNLVVVVVVVVRVYVLNLYLLCSVDVDGKVSTVPHQVCIADVMFDYTTPKNDHPRTPCKSGNTIQIRNVLNDVDDEARIAKTVHI
jgi:hypothetical protein